MMPPFEMYDLALRVWERDSIATDRNADDYVYYNDELNEFRLHKYLLTIDQLATFTEGGYALVEHYKPMTTEEWTPLGEIIGLKTAAWFTGPDGPPIIRPGYWIVLNLGQVEIIQGSNSRKPASIVSDGIRD